MEAKGHDRKAMVCFLEFLGTALFIFGIIMTNGPVSIPFSLFASVVIFGDITGGHFNPAVTLGVYLQTGDYVKNLPFMIMIWFSQFCGGFLAGGLSYLGSFGINADFLPALAPKNPITGAIDNVHEDDSFTMYIPVLVNEVVCTFLFVSVILMVKGKHTADGRGGVHAAICVVSTLLCVISGTNSLGACFNPAVATGVTSYSVYRLSPELDRGGYSNEYLYAYVWCYMLGPLTGALIAGLYHNIIHKRFFEPEDNTHGMGQDASERMLSNH